MKKLLLALALFCIPHTAYSLDIEDAKVFVPMTGQTTTAAYMTINNATGTDDILQSVEVAGVGMSEMHTTEQENGVMKMRSLESIPVAAGEIVTLAPGGMHIMLMNVTMPLEVGDTLPVVLNFNKAGKVTKDFTVTTRN